MRLSLAVLTFTLIVGVADWYGNGHGYAGLLYLVIWYGVVATRTIRTQNYILCTMVGLSFFMLPLCIVQMWFMPRARGIFDSANYLGGYAVLNIFLCFILRERIYDPGLPWSIGSNVVMLLLSQSRGAIVAAALGSAIIFHQNLKPRSAAGLLLCAAILVALITLTRATHDPRIAIWLDALAAGLQHPWLGWGQQGIALGWNGLSNFYNIPIQWFVYSGIVGILAGGWMLAEAVRRGRYEHLAFFVAWFVTGLTMSSRPETDIALFTVLGVISGNVNLGAIRVVKDKALTAGAAAVGVGLVPRGGVGQIGRTNLT